MGVFLIILISIEFTCVSLYRHQKPLAQSLWTERCKRHSRVLNDCNWCWCDNNQRYQCKARVCEEVDMFGHFKDAIQEINVGMEGHGVWRSRPQSCTPGVHYRRGGILCVCDEEGNWPNPVCRDLFRVLHSVEVTAQDQVKGNKTCFPTKLYLVGCNVCFCPSSGFLDPQLCTTKECQEDDPVLNAKDQVSIATVQGDDDNDEQASEIYAICDPNYKYELGCMKCDCLRNNRLLCNNCTSSHTHLTIKEPQLTQRSGRDFKKSYCFGKKAGVHFAMQCNICYCDAKRELICTSRKCIKGPVTDLVNAAKSANSVLLKTSYSPTDDENCIPGTTYQKDCNTCTCIEIPETGERAFMCTLKRCYDKRKISATEIQKFDCVENTSYELNCMICTCLKVNRNKLQVCKLNPECKNIGIPKKGNNRKAPELSSMHGYCQPFHIYLRDCNICRCLSDGANVICTSKLCKKNKRTLEPLTVDIVPVEMKHRETCPKGHSYKLDCNLCFCLSNGNAICTTADCSEEIKILM